MENWESIYAPLIWLAHRWYPMQKFLTWNYELFGAFPSLNP